MSEEENQPQNIPDTLGLPPNWKECLIDRFSKGHTNEEIIAWIARQRKGKFTLNMFYKWYHKYADFKEAVDTGNLYKKAWWLAQGRENIGDSRFNTPLYIRMMMNLFKWRTDNSIVDIGDKIDLKKLNDEELKQYRALQNRMKSNGSNGNNGVEKATDDAPSFADRKPKPEFARTGRD
jgi:hypothetical protein